MTRDRYLAALHQSLAAGLNDLQEITEVVEDKRNSASGAVPNEEIDELTDAATKVLRLARALIAKPLPNSSAVETVP